MPTKLPRAPYQSAMPNATGRIDSSLGEEAPPSHTTHAAGVDLLSIASVWWWSRRPRDGHCAARLSGWTGHLAPPQLVRAGSA